MSNEMTISTIISQLGSIRDDSADFAKGDPENDVWQNDIAACETAIKILAALVEEGCKDFEQVLDVLQDYRNQAKQYAKLQKQFEVAGKPVYRYGLWHCPACNLRTNRSHSYCPRCGKKLRWA